MVTVGRKANANDKYTNDTQHVTQTRTIRILFPKVTSTGISDGNFCEKYLCIFYCRFVSCTRKPQSIFRFDFQFQAETSFPAIKSSAVCIRIGCARDPYALRHRYVSTQSIRYAFLSQEISEIGTAPVSPSPSSSQH